MNTVFNQKVLMLSTAVVFILGMVSYFGKSSAMLVVMFAGFIYTIVLWVSLVNKPHAWRFWVVIFVLGIANYFSIYTVAPLVFLPEIIADFFAVILSSLIGAIVTILCITQIWRAIIERSRAYLILALILASSALFTVINLYARGNFYNYGFTIVFNTIFWWLMFSIGLVLPLEFTNKQLKKDQ